MTGRIPGAGLPMDVDVFISPSPISKAILKSFLGIILCKMHGKETRLSLIQWGSTTQTSLTV
ncbi:MAG: hypothetical protein JSC189_001046 [Candidatus Tokpelaia sp. JSC189]|nr:MAG: hypothetical protein JSC189_001046 [Candidatus Tokpelaia sp. JSC189]